MKVYVDVSVLTLATFVTGIQRVTKEVLLRLIAKKEPEVVLMHYNARENSYYRIDNEAFVMYYVNHKGRKEKMITKQRLPYTCMEAGDILFEVDAVWMCKVKRSFLYPLLQRQGVKIIPFIHDIISIEYPQYCLERGVYNFTDFIGAAMMYGRTMITTTHAVEHTLQKLSEKLGIALPPCAVNPLGADFSQKGKQRIAEETVPAQVREAVKSGAYILMVGTLEPRKNNKLLLDAYDKQLKDLGYHIIFAGYMGWNMEVFKARLEAHPDFGAGVYHFEGLSDAHISYLYQHARYMAFCSYQEGFGIPLIEAFHMGTPVIASDIPVSREVAGDYCRYFEQDNAEALCAQIRQLDDNPAEYAQIKDNLKNYKAITWEACADGILKVLREA